MIRSTLHNTRAKCTAEIPAERALAVLFADSLRLVVPIAGTSETMTVEVSGLTFESLVRRIKLLEVR